MNRVCHCFKGGSFEIMFTAHFILDGVEEYQNLLQTQFQPKGNFQMKIVKDFVLPMRACENASQLFFSDKLIKSFHCKSLLLNIDKSYFLIELLLVHEKFKWKQSHPCLIPQHLQFLMWAAILNRQLILTYLPMRARLTWWMRQTILLSSVFVVILGKILYKCKKSIINITAKQIFFIPAVHSAIFF